MGSLQVPYGEPATQEPKPPAKPICRTTPQPAGAVTATPAAVVTMPPCGKRPLVKRFALDPAAASDTRESCEAPGSWRTPKSTYHGPPTVATKVCDWKYAPAAGTDAAKSEHGGAHPMALAGWFTGRQKAAVAVAVGVGDTDAVAESVSVAVTAGLADAVVDGDAVTDPLPLAEPDTDGETEADAHPLADADPPALARALALGVHVGVMLAADTVAAALALRVPEAHGVAVMGPAGL